MIISIIDAVIVVAIIIGAMGGIKKGGITEVLSVVGIIVITFLSWSLKSTISVYLYKYLPFFQFGGDFKGVSSLNILVYELIAFFIIAGILSIILGIVLKLTGAIERLFKNTVILGLPSRIIGAIAGGIEAYVVVFIILCVLNNPFIGINVGESKLATIMMERTPVISSLVNDTIISSKEIYGLVQGRKKYSRQELDAETLKILLEHEVVDPGSAYYLVEKGKITFDENLAKSIIKAYEK